MFRWGSGSSTAPPLATEWFAEFWEYGPDLESFTELKGCLEFLAGHVSHGKREGIQSFEHGSVFFFTWCRRACLFGLHGHLFLRLACAAVHGISIHNTPFDHI